MCSCKVYTNEDNSLYLSKGDLFPYVCPECGKFTEFYEADVIECAWCSYVGFPEEFEEAEWVGARDVQ